MSRIAGAGIASAAAVMTMLAPLPAAAESPGRMLAVYRDRTSIEPHCARATRSDEIVVCGNRRADRWRVPFVGYDAGDPRGESVTGERNRLASEPPVRCGEGAILKNCGSVGVTARMGFGARSQGLRLRPLAP